LASGHFAALSNGVCDFAGFSETDANPAFFVAHNYQGAEIESASAFHYLGGTIDKHHLLDQFLALVPVMHFLGPSASAESSASALTASATSAEISFGAMVTARFGFDGWLRLGSGRGGGGGLLGGRTGWSSGGLLGFFWLGRF
jgi:hypothetical protein